MLAGMQRLAVCVDLGVLAPALGLLAMLATRREPPRPERDDALIVNVITPVLVEPQPEPVEHHPGACRELYDFRFPTHIGADGIPDEIVTRTFDDHGRV